MFFLWCKTFALNHQHKRKHGIYADNIITEFSQSVIQLIRHQQMSELEITMDVIHTDS